MKTKRLESALLLMLVIAPAGVFAGWGCAGSLRPIASPETLTTAPQIEGTWLSENESDPTITVTRTAEKSYQARWKEDNKDADLVFDLSFLQIEGKLFFDAAFNRLETKQGPETTYNLGVVPIHFIGWVWVEGQSMRVGLLHYDWLKQRVDEGQVKLPYLEHHADDDHWILFTAKAEDMQGFLRQHAEDQEAFSDIMKFERAPMQDSSATPKP